jgi:hypothetical protein
LCSARFHIIPAATKYTEHMNTANTEHSLNYAISFQRCFSAAGVVEALDFFSLSLLAALFTPSIHISLTAKSKRERKKKNLFSIIFRRFIVGWVGVGGRDLAGATSRFSLAIAF